MIQNSLSPVVKSRISSSSGRTMSVEKRSFARTGTMSSLEYFTTRAASVAARTAEGGNATATTRVSAVTKTNCDQLKLIGFIASLLWKTFLPSGNLKFGRRKIEESTEPHKGRQPETPLPEETRGGATVRPCVPRIRPTRQRETPESRALSRQHLEASLEPMLLKSLFPRLVVIRIVGVEPVAPAIDVQIRNLPEFRRLDQELLLGNQVRNEFDFGFVQVKLPPVEIAVHIGIREKNLCRAAFDDDLEDVRALQLIERLRREDHGGIVLAPGLQGLDHIALDAGILEKHPGFVDEKSFENRASLAIRDNGIRAMQDVEEQRFQEFRIPAHALEVEGLEARKRNGVFGVVEQKPELPAAGPFGEAARKILAQGIGEHSERTQRGIDRVEILDLVIEIAFGRGIEFTVLLVLHQDLQEESEEVEIFLGGCKREWVDLEIPGLQTHARIGAAKQMRKAFKAPAQIEDECVGLVLLEVRDQEIQ